MAYSDPGSDSLLVAGYDARQVGTELGGLATAPNTLQLPPMPSRPLPSIVPLAVAAALNEASSTDAHEPKGVSLSFIH